MSTPFAGVPPTTNIHATIPTRILTSPEAPLEVKDSSILGAGRGIFAVKNVSVGGLLFRIPQRTLKVVEDKEIAMSTCDYCLDHRLDKGGGIVYRTTVREGFAFIACGACDVVYYCSKKCQKKAWDLYHELECRAINSVVTGNGTDDKILRELIHDRGMRCVLRLIALHDSHSISDEFWGEFLAMEPGCKKRGKNNKKEKEKLRVCWRLAHELHLVTKTAIPEATICDLVYKFDNNGIDIMAPLLRDVSMTSKYFWQPNFIRLGQMIDPFVALINHACIPNAVAFHDRDEVRVRAESSIKAGEEITISYLKSRNDYITRQEMLTERFNFECTCTLCQKKQMGATGRFRTEINTLARGGHLNGESVFVRVYDLERAIEKMEVAGFGYHIYPLRELYVQLVDAHLLVEHTNSTKVALKVLYFIDNLKYKETGMPRFAKLDFLLKASALVYMALDVHDNRVKAVVARLHFHLLSKRMANTKKLIGLVSPHVVVVCEQIALENYKQDAQKYSRLAEFTGGLGGHDNEQRDFARKMNNLLSWAGIEKKLPLQAFL